ncbi:hypothetical protein CVT25_010680 [Psilocybe cyanescens]|uniref:Uncharacterized protein n=1 Tax=Psilocybe cyanescens TaxID=93625 RepID=A0A409WK13_PSICY|nr:hypothetical protein CVT25_010680 [Psilocybe cyanescens]
MPPAEESFQSLVNKTFNANYNVGITQDLNGLPEEPIAPPFEFYDRHVSSNHILKNVVYLPSIPHLLSKTCDNAVRDFITNDHKFSYDGYDFDLEMPKEKFKDARSVGTYYSDNVGEISEAYMSKLCIHPYLDTWESVFQFQQDISNKTFYRSEGYLCLFMEPFRDFFSESMKEGLPISTQVALRELFDKYPRQAMWHFFPMLDTFTTILRNVTKDIKFNWETARTKGYEIKTHTGLPPDGEALTKKLHVNEMSRNRKFEPYSLATKKTVNKASKRVTPPQKSTRSSYRPDFRHYLQHAWAQAAIYDTTFIIFNCGRYQRIGIRHRASQTLYLSGVIDTVNIQNPHYMKLNLGLLISIVRDALERKKLVDSLVTNPEYNNIKTRSADNLEDKETPKSKRQKQASGLFKCTDILFKELVHRKLALVSLDYNALCSPVPSSFIRIGESCMRDSPTEGTDWTNDECQQKIYSNQEYFILKLLAPIGSGAIGVAHPAQVQLTLESGEVLEGNLVFKMAFTEERQQKLKHEFEMYCRISRTEGIEGVVDVHGLFHDLESGAMGMLMADGGQNLRQREMERIGAYAEQVTTTWREK